MSNFLALPVLIRIEISKILEGIMGFALILQASWTELAGILEYGVPGVIVICLILFFALKNNQEWKFVAKYAIIIGLIFTVFWGIVNSIFFISNNSLGEPMLSFSPEDWPIEYANLFSDTVEVNIIDNKQTLLKHSFEPSKDSAQELISVRQKPNQANLFEILFLDKKLDEFTFNDIENRQIDEQRMPIWNKTLIRQGEVWEAGCSNIDFDFTIKTDSIIAKDHYYATLDMIVRRNGNTQNNSFTIKNKQVLPAQFTHDELYLSVREANTDGQGHWVGLTVFPSQRSQIVLEDCHYW